MDIIYFLTTLLSGVVTDNITNEPLCGVEIKIDTESYYTDINGVFTIPTLDVDTIDFTYVSYKDTTIFL